MNNSKLFKRNAQGNIISWEITKLEDGTLRIEHGIYGKKKHTEVIEPTAIKVDEYKSRITAKRKEGYKALEDLYDNSPEYLDDYENARKGNVGLNYDALFNYLEAYLPKYNTTSEGFVLPMLAKTLEDNKPFEKAGDALLGQWKINGLRCLIGAKRNELDMFYPIILTYHSRTGEDWTPKMSWMDEILISKMDTSLLDMMIEEDAYLDGELYLPGHTVNDINSFVKNTELPQHYKLQYWCYDIACDNINAEDRINIRYNGFNCKSGRTLHIDIETKEDHLNNKDQLVLLPTYSIYDFTEAVEHRNNFIDLGFEGLILRNPAAEYAFGKRNQSMFKFKKKEDGKFKIVDIKEDKRGLPIFVLRNDINEELFESTINLPQNEQKKKLNMKQYLIGKMGLVEYRERSGIKQVPFHAKLLKIFI